MTAYPPKLVLNRHVVDRRKNDIEQNEDLELSKEKKGIR